MSIADTIVSIYWFYYVNYYSHQVLQIHIQGTLFMQIACVSSSSKFSTVDLKSIGCVCF